MKHFLIFLILYSFLSLSNGIQAQELSLTLRGLRGTFLTGSEKNPKIFLGEVDALGISPNPMGEVVYDEDRHGAFYSFAIEIITSGSNPNFKGGQLSVTRSSLNRANSIPMDALYDADFGTRIGPGPIFI